MLLRLYREILKFIKDRKTQGCLDELKSRFPDIPALTLWSICIQEHQRKTRKRLPLLRKPGVVDGIYKRCVDERDAGKKNVILKIADEIDLSPSLVARVVLDRYLMTMCDTTSDKDGCASKTDKGRRNTIKQLLKEPSSISDPWLSEEVQVCILADENYGPLMDNVKHSVGHEYEFELQRRANEKGLCFLDEETLRSRGYDKTPDLKLEVPIGVDGHVVNWIESKASFGDPETHESYLKDQYWSYWNRFGPGLVVYWFGFVDELDVNRSNGILLMDRFPVDIVTLGKLECGSSAPVLPPTSM